MKMLQCQTADLASYCMNRALQHWREPAGGAGA